MSELSGILHIIMIIEKLYAKFAIIEGAVTVSCNGLDYIRMAMDKNTSFSRKPNHFDMISAIDAKIQKYRLQLNWRHVKGHPDD